MYIAFDTSPFHSSGELKKHAQDTAAARAAVDAYATAMREQSPIKLDLLPNLPTHLENAKEHAKSWTEKVAPEIIQVNTDLISFCNLFKSFYKTLYDLAKDINAEGNLEKFNSGITELSEEVTKRGESAKKATKSINGLYSNVATDKGKLTKDINDEEAKYQGEQGKLAEIKKLESSLRDRIHKDVLIMAGGATVDVVGVLCIAVGVLAEIPSGGTSTAVIVAGVALVTGGTAAMIAAGVDMDKANKDLANQIAEYAKISKEIAALKSVNTQWEHLVAACTDALGSLNKMSTTWEVLGTQFKAVKDEIKEVEEKERSMFLTNHLEAAKKDWDDLDKTAKAIQKQLTNLPVRKGKS
ncbi:HBL/NHE enterotoxin family protein [Streptomyces albireticuli]|uniref:Enterotoxin n=1 Tax=Streptomyces albireticuli TaxID=1940 RepID=A0A2A2DGT4_9ACTN|nr:HBL/NHE enterotoxin family protein [Streptomyces albireticuli]MCD9146048.1 alpha-helical pore-forming toxin family protein [Streptomyces albireticuli]MCD9166203.1 alpha-helical pore-forming toxin family protein [Streptomyces albireticuli]MCD9196525.1 alpha-helical pore-forming toxin family protein [Streptomyces albireticuli]PAU50667.1 hypothetical protein CK936_01300 [Streptomyces albireticuli]